MREMVGSVERVATLVVGHELDIDITVEAIR